jgi:Mg2+ and Co2+ transporter CorA
MSEDSVSKKVFLETRYIQLNKDIKLYIEMLNDSILKKYRLMDEYKKLTNRSIDGVDG